MVRHWHTVIKSAALYKVAVIALIMLTGVSNAVIAEETNNNHQQVNDLLPKLELATLSQGSFSQYKHLKVLTKPIISTGQVIIDPEQGLLWKTEQPISSILRITEQEIFEIKENALVANSQQASKQFSVYLFAIFKGDWSLLANDFTVEVVEKSKTSWVISLTPKSVQINKLFSKITIKGADNIDKITLFETGGNFTEIKLLMTSVELLNELDRGYFAL